MWRSMTALRGDVILARDGDIGHVADVYFDDARWTVRYFVIDTGHVMPERWVLLEPPALVEHQPDDRVIRVRLTRQEVERSPEADSAVPVSQQSGLPPRWRARDRHLRSCEVVVGYEVQALDGPAGHVSDFVLDGSSWAIERMVVDTGTWFPGPRVLVDPGVIRTIDWPWRKLHIALTRERVRAAPRA
jgi:hypothetical protein